MLMFILLCLLGALDLLALRWGFDSREKLDSPEWARRQNDVLH